MSLLGYGELRVHIGHRIECVAYSNGTSSEPQNVAVECVDCFVVIVDYDREE